MMIDYFVLWAVIRRGINEESDVVLKIIFKFFNRCGEFLLDSEYFNKLDQHIEEHISQVVAIGEIGLDYDRLHFCEPDIQKK